MFSIMDKLSKKVSALDLTDVAKALTPAPTAPARGALDDALDIVRLTEPVDVSTLPDLEARINHLLAIRSKLFAIEHEARAKVDKEINRLKAQSVSMATAAKFTADQRYKPLDHKVLTWRHANGLPKLGIFSLNTPYFSIDSRNGIVPDSLPYGVRLLYQDVVDKLVSQHHASRYQNSRRIGWKHYGASAKFSGMIPDDVRAKIHEAAPIFGDNIFIIAEVDMQVSTQDFSVPAPVRIGDPILVGWAGTQLWYIDDFDTTPVEEAALLVGPHNPAK